VALNEGHRVQGLADLPVDAIVSAVQGVYRTAVREPNDDIEWLVWVSPNEQDSFQITWSSQHVRADCRHVHTDDMNQIIDIITDFGCALYDPQVGERFAQQPARR
jgi:hypothetical protein